MNLILWMILHAASASAGTISVFDQAGRPLASAMVTERPIRENSNDTSDGGYPKPNVFYNVEPDVTRFTNARGQVSFPERKLGRIYRVRKPTYIDQEIAVKVGSNAQPRVTLKSETDLLKLAGDLPGNAWLGALEIGSAQDKVHFRTQCGFCHQQGTPFVRRERSVEDWSDAIQRMVRYGARLPSALQKSLPTRLQSAYGKLRDDPSLLTPPPEWSSQLQKTTITEWPFGNGFSQTHDVLVGRTGLVYVADNIQDRIYELDVKTNRAAVYKIPHLPEDQPGGLIAGRLRDFPSHDSTSNAHSIAESKVDGHLFITPSAQRRIIEFNPDDKAFKIHFIDGGFYPHTIRIDAKDRVWFTLALSNQIGMLDRKTGGFKLYDLPVRSFREKLVVRFMPFIFKLIAKGVPLANLLPIDGIATGTPLPYGIDITPDGKVWFARLHTQEIGNVDPESGVITMVPTPFHGPRRLRTDAEGNLWVVAFGDSLLAEYDPKSGKFRKFELPVTPKGSETPYSLFVDDRTKIVWVTGNQSNSAFAFDMKTEAWLQIPFPKRTTFTRDFDRDEAGAIYTANSNFPSWQIEDGQPTLIQLRGDWFSK